MDIKNLFTTKRLIFIAIFTVLVLVGKNINFSPLVGADNQFFTLFQFFGPIAGGFLGALFGAVAVLFAELIDFFVVGKEASLLNILRLTPMIFAAYYFGTKKKNFGVAVPIIAILAFILHPVGREVWFFTLFWTIPIIGKLLPKKFSNNVLVKSYGATFAAHAVGGALWIWTVPMTAAQWIALIPIVFVERFLFGAGIAVSYVTFNVLFHKVLDTFKINIPADILRLDKKFTLRA
tara:strand:+ start:5531 stop:6235 length:705 start_codon:yes stop_codon:yes gene_type:complete